MRCAIYTRKSSTDGLEQAFNSLDAQRECCASYIASQASNGWMVLGSSYDDGGVSGGTLDRPSLHRLLADVDAGLVDVIVVYKIDRLSRSLTDFVRLVAQLEARGVIFVSVTQSFSTTTSMGRLTLNVLLSFAQFERELTSERLKDKFAASRARGMWLCGPRPLGYRVVDRYLVVDPAEAIFVRRIYKRYPQIGSLRHLADELRAEGHLNHQGRPIAATYLRDRLATRLYLGELPRGSGSIPGCHEAIVTHRQWEAVQTTMAAASARRAPLTVPADLGMLRGLVFGVSGHAMICVRAKGRGSAQYRYYVSGAVARYGAGASPCGRFRADEFEMSVAAALDAATPKAPEFNRDRTATAAMIRSLVERIDINDVDMVLQLRTGRTIRADFAGRLSDAPRPVGRRAWGARVSAPTQTLYCVQRTRKQGLHLVAGRLRAYTEEEPAATEAGRIADKFDGQTIGVAVWRQVVDTRTGKVLDGPHLLSSYGQMQARC